jgi:hypothetical protein
MTAGYFVQSFTLCDVRSATNKSIATALKMHTRFTKKLTQKQTTKGLLRVYSGLLFHKNLRK